MTPEEIPCCELFCERDGFGRRPPAVCFRRYGADGPVLALTPDGCVRSRVVPVCEGCRDGSADGRSWVVSLDEGWPDWVAQEVHDA